MSRIRIADVPELAPEVLTDEELAELMGAGKVRLGVEALEERKLMTVNTVLGGALNGLKLSDFTLQYNASYNTADKVLSINGTSMSDSVRVMQSGNTLSLENNSVIETVTPSKTGGLPTYGKVATLDARTISRIQIDGKSGSDTLSLDPTVKVAATINGGDGNDIITGGNLADIIYGGPGNDIIKGMAGYDQIFGDMGAAGIGVGNDILYGGPDGDLIEGDAGDDRIYGEAGNDQLRGNAGNDEVYGGDGDDALDGNDGDDYLAGEADKDLLIGLAGNDWLEGGAGNDRLIGDGNGTVGSDVLKGGIGNDALEGGEGNDILEGEAGNDSLKGDGGDDVLVGGDGNDSLTGDAGSDNLYGEAGNDSLYGGEGDDGLLGDTGNDRLEGHAGNDRLEGGIGNDSLQGHDGDDSLAGDAGNDALEGGSGNDALRGSEGNDNLRGGDGNDSLSGDAGNDSLFGDAGDDNLVGGAGVNKFDGGAGVDMLDGKSEVHSILLSKGLVQSDIDALGVAISAALRGPEAKNLVFNGNTFHVKAVEREYESGGITYRGWISRVKSGFDDQLSYTVRIRDDGSNSLTFNLDDNAGLHTLAISALAAACFASPQSLGAFEPATLAAAEQEHLTNLKTQSFAGSWQNGSKFLMQEIASALKEQYLLDRKLHSKGVAYADMGNSQRAIEAVMNGVSKHEVKLFNHEFRVHALSSTANADGSVRFTGTIDHLRSVVADDHVTFSYSVKNGVVTDLQYGIIRGGVIAMAQGAFQALALTGGAPLMFSGLKTFMLDQLLTRLDQATDGSWESAAKFLIEGISNASAQRLAS